VGLILWAACAVATGLGLRRPSLAVTFYSVRMSGHNGDITMITMRSYQAPNLVSGPLGRFGGGSAADGRVVGRLP